VKAHFLDQVAGDSLKDWEIELIEVVRAAIEEKEPTRLDTSKARVRIIPARALKSRYVEIVLPHSEDDAATLELSRDDHEIFIDSAYGTICLGGDELPVVETFLHAAFDGNLEFETQYKKDGKPKRARAWRVSDEGRELLGEMLAWRTKTGWSTAVTNRPTPFL
jgi:hypothetical protein